VNYLSSLDITCREYIHSYICAERDVKFQLTNFRRFRSGTGRRGGPQVEPADPSLSIKTAVGWKWGRRSSLWI